MAQGILTLHNLPKARNLGEVHFARGERDRSQKTRASRSIAKLCPTLCDPVDCSMPGFSVHCLPELAQVHVDSVDDAIQPSHPLLFPSPPAFNLSQHQGLFQFLARARPPINVSLEEWPVLFLTLLHIRSLALSRGLSITIFLLLDVQRKGETPCHQVSGWASSRTLHPALGMPRRPGCHSILQAPELSHGVAHCLGFPPRISALRGI